MLLDGQFAFQDYAVAKWFYHLNAWAGSGEVFLSEAENQTQQLDDILVAMDDFMNRYDQVDWEKGLVGDCKSNCSVFERHRLYDHLVQLTSHIYTFQQKGFEARHKISIQSLETALLRNRKIQEEFPTTKPAPTTDEKAAYSRYYDGERPFKCTRITCRYFSEGFKDKSLRQKHVNVHDRPYQCEVLYCVGAEGFANQRDLEKHKRAFHPDMSDLADVFIAANPNRATNHACSICGQTFTRNFARKNHELSHLGEKPHECAECGRAFTRRSDLKRHQKLHEKA